ncbi:MAG TPA: helix-turn-helix domain-containing protein [Armatimonadota bacterium]|nr:helix-turn-helix domain-containing protein [Armatimonadota bacterium]
MTGNAPQADPGPPTEERDDDVLDMDEAVAFLKTTKPTLYRWINQGKVQGFKAGRQWRFYRRDLRKFLEYDDPTAAGIDLDAVRDAIGVLEERIARARAARE